MINQDLLRLMTTILEKNYVPFLYEKFENDIRRFLEEYSTLSSSQRELIQACFGAAHSARLLYFCNRMSESAVRKCLAVDIQLGILAIDLDGAQEDYRMTLISLCQLFHSSQKIGVDPYRLFREGAIFGNLSTQKFIEKYLESGTKDIHLMNLEESYGPDGFYYASVGL